jgi:hypothetical protein
MNWPLLRTCLVFTALATTFNLGRMSIEFRDTGSDWTMLVLGVLILITSLIGLAAGEFVRDKPKGN